MVRAELDAGAAVWAQFAQLSEPMMHLGRSGSDRPTHTDLGDFHTTYSYCTLYFSKWSHS